MRRGVEWPTFLLIAGCYAAWLIGTGWLASVWLPAGFALTVLAIALFSSLQHEVLHGHPFRGRLRNEALVFPALTVFVPYRRFRDTHIAHHRDERLTDPYDDPESNYLDPAVWGRLPGWQRMVLRANNTLLGRMVLGPAISTLVFTRADLRAIRAGDRAVAKAWAMHALGFIPVAAWLWFAGGMGAGTYLAAAYTAFAILKIRTYLEHRAHETTPGRTVIVEGGGLLAFLFLNNSLHAVHHALPEVSWYRLPALYRARRPEFLAANGGYRYAGYGEVFRRYLLRAKDPVAHPYGRG